MDERIVYFNGDWVPETEARVSILDRGFQGGEGVYDVGRTYGHEAFRLRRHVERLFRSLRYTRIEIDETPDQMEKIADELLSRNLPLLGEFDEYAIWFNVSRGVWPWVPTAVRKGRPTVAAYCLPIPFRAFARYYREGARLVVSSVRRTPPECLEPRAKVTNKINHLLADLEAKDRDPDAYPLMLDMTGNLAESSASNLMFVFGGALYSPTSRNIIEGMTREAVFEIAREGGLAIREGNYTTYDLFVADEAFLTANSLAILLVASVNGRPFPAGAPGPVTTRLMEGWRRLVGVDFVARACRHLESR